MSEPTQILLTLHPHGVAAPTLRAVEQSTEIVSFYMQSLEKADLSKAPEFERARFQVKFSSAANSEERKVHYTSWILSKGFQDLARGIRTTLEEAYFYISLANSSDQLRWRKTTWDAVQQKIQQYHEEAEAMSFPELMGAVSRGLTSPLHFEKEFLSLQKVRNCLEHRDGIVGEKDVDKGTKLLKLSLPYLRMYGKRNGQITEVGKGSVLEAGSSIVLKNEIQEREFRLGERVTFNPEEFHDIGYGCLAFAQDLKSKLPQIDPAAKPLQPSLDKPKELKTKPPRKLRARLPRGLSDLAGPEIAATRDMIEKIRVVYESYGFEPVETPAIEYTDALGKFLPDQDRPNEGVFSFQDDDEQWLSLRYDLTAPLARYVAENFDALPKPYRSYRVGWVFRNEKPGPGRFRQFMQFDADTVGSSSPAADAEMCMMAADTMEKLGVPCGSYVVRMNSRKLLDGLMQAVGLTGEENAEKRLTTLRALDKYERLGKTEVKKLLGVERRDESGDVTKGAGLNDYQIDRIIYFLTLRSEPWGIVETTKDSFNPRIELLPKDSAAPYEIDLLTALDNAYGQNEIFHAGIKELRDIEKLFIAAGHAKGKVILDPSVVRGLEYYTGPVFEVELTFPTGKDGTRFGSVGGGGRYDGLVSRFRGEPVPATGFSIGVSRLAAALQHLETLPAKTEPGPVLVAVFADRDPDVARDNLMSAQKMAMELRQAGIRAEAYLGNPKNLGNQFKYADKRNSPCVVIQGPEEKAVDKVQIKDLISGTEQAIAHGAFDPSRREYLEQRLAQRPVSRTELVKAVRQTLEWHGLTPKR